MFYQISILLIAVATLTLAYPQHGHTVSHQVVHIAAHATPAVAYHAAAPAIAYHAAPAATVYHTAPAVQYHAAPVAVKAAPVVHHEPVAPAYYDFEYAVHDPHTGDVKEQKESRKDDVVEGYYSLIESDGRKRTVHYKADKHNGFNAVVTHEGKAVHAQPVHAKAVAAPVVSYAAPIAAATHHGYATHY